MIPVTKSFLPPIQDYQKQIQRVFENQWLTNRGKLVVELEEKLKSFLKIDNILITNNGTIPLQIALKLLGKGGEIITTPFSYVATTAAIVWENCTPVFVDINRDNLTIDASKIEEKITDKTSCILATHVFGNPCDVVEIERIAQKHNLKVIYDGAHAFGVRFNGKSIFEYGDISTCSFHATKLFHTGEGGAIFCNDPKLRETIFYSHNFGHKDEISFHGLGLNGKISELQAAMGLSVYPFLNQIIASREDIIKQYINQLNWSALKTISIRNETEWNNSYFPIICNSETQLNILQEILNKEGIFPRRYFYPTLNKLNYVSKSTMPIAEQISSNILCLPLYVGLESKDIERITSIINQSILTTAS